jgi:hypothetical protein
MRDFSDISIIKDMMKDKRTTTKERPTSIAGDI